MFLLSLSVHVRFLISFKFVVIPWTIVWVMRLFTVIPKLTINIVSCNCFLSQINKIKIK